ncbi:mediator complex subunit [Thecaphora frezii]
MSATQHNEPAEPNKSHTAALNRNGAASLAHANGRLPHQNIQHQYTPHNQHHQHHPQQQQHHHQHQQQQQQQHHRHQQPSANHHAVARIKSESLNGSQKFMMGIPPANTPEQPHPVRANGTKANGHDATYTSTQASVAAADAKGKAREVDPIHEIPIEQLEQELPLEEADLVPLAALVERLANHGYEAFQNLAETLPSLPSSSRRAKIFATALDVRKQFVKLLVLVRWSKDVSDLQKARNIISLLSEQQWQHEDVFAGLTDVRKILPNARMRNADLPTAIDVLRTGTYRRLPTSIKDMVVPAKPFTDEEAIEIVAQLEDSLRLRMACREIVPAPMSRYRIQDGKVHFRVPGLFETQLTASSSGLAPTSASAEEAAAADRWWLLDLKFDIRITGSNAEAAIKLFPRKPRKAYRERLRIWGDHELEPKVVQQEQGARNADDDQQEKDLAESADSKKKEGYAADTAAPPASTTELGGAQQQLSPNSGRDVPLVRLYAFLQERSLHYQMDILQYQARELMRLNWGSNLCIETQERPRALLLHYWTNTQTGQTSTGPGPAKGGCLRIAIADQVGNVGKKRIIADLLGDHDDPKEQAEQGQDDKGDRTEPMEMGRSSTPYLVKRRYLQVNWEVDEAIRAEASGVNLGISSQALDLERLLTELVQKHAAALLRVLQKRILVGQHAVSKGLRPQDCRICTSTIRRKDAKAASGRVARPEYLRIDLLGSGREGRSGAMARSTGMPALRLKIDVVSGRLQLEAETEASAPAIKPRRMGQQHHATMLTSLSAGPLAARRNSARLSDASDRINASVDSLLDALHRLEIFARVEEWERKASYIGLRTLRRLNFKPSEYAKFGPSLATCGPPVLYIPLGSRFQGFFLALQPSETTGVNIALLSTAQVVEGPGAVTMVLQSIEWLDRVRIATASTSTSGSDEASLGKRKRVALSAGVAPQAAPSIGLGELTLEELASVHSYSVALVAYVGVEQQLRARAIPYVHVSKPTSGSRSAKLARIGAGQRPASTQALEEADVLELEEDAVEGDASAAALSLVPTLCLRIVDLLGPAKAHLARRNASIQVCEWWDRDKIRAEISIKLRMRSRRLESFRSDIEPSPLLAPFLGGVRQTSQSPRYSFEFDGSTSILTFSTSDLENCVLAFLTEWQRVSRAIELAREVLNVGRDEARQTSPASRANRSLLELVEFRLDAVTFAYGRAVGLESKSTEASGPPASNRSGRRLLLRVRWEEARLVPNQMTGIMESVGGGYRLDFGSGEPGSRDSTEWFGERGCEANPHRAIAHELTRGINAKSKVMDSGRARTVRRADRIWRGFFQLLRETLPVVREVQPLIQGCLEDVECPELEIRSATWFRVLFLDKHALDIRITNHSHLVLYDASQPLFRSPTKGLEAPSAAAATGPGPADALFTLAISASLQSQSAQQKGDGPPPLDATSPYLAIPRFGDLVKSVCDELPEERRTASDVVDLKRVLLCSIDPDVVSKVLPALIVAIRSQIAPAAKMES